MASPTIVGNYEVDVCKIGYELETHFWFLQRDPKSLFSTAQKSESKGSLLDFFIETKAGNEVRFRLDDSDGIWIPTVEDQSFKLESIQMEIISGGKTGGVFLHPDGSQFGYSKNVGEQIFAFLQRLRHFASPPGALYARPNSLQGVPTKWWAKVDWKNADYSADDNVGGLHMTTALPLAAIPMIRDNRLLFAFLGGRVFPLTLDDLSECLEKNNVVLKWKNGLPGHLGPMTLCGFMILVLSYVKIAANPPSTLSDMDLKLATPLMPRTDFRTMLNIVTDLLDDASAKNLRASLSKMTEFFFPASGATKFSSWVWSWHVPVDEGEEKTPMSGGSSTPATKPTDPKKTPNAPAVISDTLLPVTVWLESLANHGADLIAVKDQKYRSGQIGGLKNKVERLILGKGTWAGPDAMFYCPILEFRDPGGVNAGELDADKLGTKVDPKKPKMTSKLQALEDLVVALHKSVLK